MRPRKVILLVDDIEIRRSLRLYLLETRGYRVIQAESSAAALEILGGMLPDALDLLMADLRLAGMDGDALARRAKAMHPTLPVLIVSDTAGSSDRPAHADAFLPKGFCGGAELLERVRLMVARKRGPKPRQVRPLAVESEALGGAA